MLNWPILFAHGVKIQEKGQDSDYKSLEGQPQKEDNKKVDSAHAVEAQAHRDL